MAPCLDSSSLVEQERLLCQVHTQKQHIEELRAQLRDTLEAHEQQQLQLVQQSPASRNVRKLLQRAAADNTALANRLESFRAQRSALCVTKAALTAQVSELMRVAAADRRREEEHTRLLHQLSHVCTLIQQPHLRKPEEQVAAVVAHIKQLYRERQELTDKLEAAMRSSSSSSGCSTTKRHHPVPVSTTAAAAAAASDQGPSSPTGQKLDQRATSQLIWTSTRSDGPGAGQQHQQRQQGLNPIPNPQAGSSSTCAGGEGAAADCCDTGSGVSDSFATAHSQLLDLSYISPLKAAGNSSQARSHTAADDTPTSRAPAPSLVADRGTSGAAGALLSGADAAGTPLSAQSLSSFGTAGALPSPRMRRALQALSPLRRCGRRSATSHMAAGAAGAGAAGTAASTDGVGCSSAGGESSSTRSSGLSSDACAGVVTPLRPTSGATPGQPSGTPGSGPCAFGSSISMGSSSKPGDSTSLLSLQPEFRLAAEDSLWPSPAAARCAGAQAGLASAGIGSAVSSHRLWLPQAEECDEVTEGSDDESSPRNKLYPRALADLDFLQGLCGTDCIADAEAEEWGSSTDGTGLYMGATQTSKGRSIRGCRAAVPAVLCAGVSLAVVVTGGAAAWRHKQAELVQVMGLVQGALRLLQARLRGVLRARRDRCAAGHSD